MIKLNLELITSGARIQGGTTINNIQVNLVLK